MKDESFNNILGNKGLMYKIEREIKKAGNDQHYPDIEEMLQIAVRTTRAHDRQYELRQKAYKIAYMILRKGDRIRASRCGGRMQTYTFKQWDGMWCASTSGVDDISPYDIDKVNGVTVNFGAMMNQRIEVLMNVAAEIADRRL